MSSKKRKSAEVAPGPLVIDVNALRTFLYEKDLYRNGRFSTNALFNEKLGPHGSEFDFVMRNTFQFFVRKHLGFNPVQLLDCQIAYMLSNNVMSHSFAITYLNVSWKTNRVDKVSCRDNILAAISHYRADFWKMLKSFVLRPCHLDTNLALSNYWGDRTSESKPGFVYQFGLNSVEERDFYSFRHDVDDHSLTVQCNGTVMGIPDLSYYDSESKTFSDEMSFNIFDQFIDMIDSTIRFVEECVDELCEFLDEDNTEEANLRANIAIISSNIVSWKANPYQLQLTVFTIVHECIEMCKRYHRYAGVAGEVDAPDPVTPATPADTEMPLKPTKVAHFEMCYLAMKHHRILTEAVYNLRSSHVWLFFSYGRSPDSKEWVLNPCGRWKTHHLSVDDFIKSETAEFWLQRVNTNSMVYFARLCWLILFKHAPDINMKSSLQKDGAYFEPVNLFNIFFYKVHLSLKLCFFR